MEKAYKQIKEIGQLVKVEKGETIYQVGERTGTFYYLEKGLVKLSKDSLEGYSHTLSFIEPSGVFGYLDSLHGQEEYTQYAVSLTDSILYSIPMTSLKSYTTIERLVFDSMVNQLTEAQELIQVLSSKTVPERLSWLLKKLAKRKGELFIMDLPLTHEELSNMLGCSRQKVTTFLNRWKKEGIILYERGVITIIKEEKLP